MATMLPEVPRDFDPKSHEGEIFSALNLLPDDYYVVHSFKNVRVEDNHLHEGETDFVIFNQHKGILCIEAKAGQVKYENNTWKYGSGKIMKHGGPYNQASSNKWDLFDTIKNSRLKEILSRCKFLHAVWFPGIRENDLLSNRLPADFDSHITLTIEDLVNPQQKIDQIFGIELEKNIQTELSTLDVKRLLREVICPEFNIFPAIGFDNDIKKIKFHRLLKEQECILNYLVEQRSAVINGAAGTGKTMIAVEKAQRHASDGESVLFLCYNTNLRSFLEENYAKDNIEYMTIAGLSCKLCKTNKPNYQKTGEILEDMYLTGTFPYTHVIVDEGQDFGNEDLEEADILQLIHDIIMDNDKVFGTFYVFYDKFQLIQGEKIPQYIADADCKLTLYRNCRNTENIAITSLKPISERKPKLYEGAIKGMPAKMHFVSNCDLLSSRIDDAINQLGNDGINDVVILTCLTEEKSMLSSLVEDGKYKNKLFSTCRKFKGLEADAIILIDVEKSTFDREHKLIYYVGSSRARLRLDIYTTMGDTECKYVLENSLQYRKKVKRPKRDLAVELNAFPSIE